MRRMKEKDDLMKVQESNHEQLIESLQTLVVSVSVFCLWQKLDHYIWIGWEGFKVTVKVTVRYSKPQAFGLVAYLLSSNTSSI